MATFTRLSSLLNKKNDPSNNKQLQLGTQNTDIQAGAPQAQAAPAQDFSKVPGSAARNLLAKNSGAELSVQPFAQIASSKAKAAAGGYQKAYDEKVAGLKSWQESRKDQLNWGDEQRKIFDDGLASGDMSKIRESMAGNFNPETDAILQDFAPTETVIDDAQLRSDAGRANALQSHFGQGGNEYGSGMSRLDNLLFKGAKGSLGEAQAAFSAANNTAADAKKALAGQWQSASGDTKKSVEDTKASQLGYLGDQASAVKASLSAADVADKKAWDASEVLAKDKNKRELDSILKAAQRGFSQSEIERRFNGVDVNKYLASGTYTGNVVDENSATKFNRVMELLGKGERLSTSGSKKTSASVVDRETFLKDLADRKNLADLPPPPPPPGPPPKDNADDNPDDGIITHKPPNDDKWPIPVPIGTPTPGEAASLPPLPGLPSPKEVIQDPVEALKKTLNPITVTKKAVSDIKDVRDKIIGKDAPPGPPTGLDAWTPQIDPDVLNPLGTNYDGITSFDYKMPVVPKLTPAEQAKVSADAEAKRLAETSAWEKILAKAAADAAAAEEAKKAMDAKISADAEAKRLAETAAWEKILADAKIENEAKAAKKAADDAAKKAAQDAADAAAAKKASEPRFRMILGKKVYF